MKTDKLIFLIMLFGAFLFILYNLSYKDKFSNMVYPVTKMTMGGFCYVGCPNVLFNNIGSPVNNTPTKVVITSITPMPEIQDFSLPLTMYGLWDVSADGGTGLDLDDVNPANAQAWKLVGYLASGSTVSVEGNIIQ